jgi:hypothetical protein
MGLERLQAAASFIRGLDGGTSRSFTYSLTSATLVVGEREGASITHFWPRKRHLSHGGSPAPMQRIFALRQVFYADSAEARLVMSKREKE